MCQKPQEAYLPRVRVRESLTCSGSFRSSRSEQGEVQYFADQEIKGIATPKTTLSITKGPFSREASADDIKGALYIALQQQLGQYSGTGEYHIVVIVDAYTLGQPGIPLVFSPQTALGFRLSVWDAATMTRYDLTPEKLLFLENATAKTMFGSGLRQTREEQIVSLTQSVAQQIDTWLREQHETKGWFEPNTKVQKYTVEQIKAEIAQ